MKRSMVQDCLLWLLFLSLCWQPVVCSTAVADGTMDSNLLLLQGISNDKQQMSGDSSNTNERALLDLRGGGSSITSSGSSIQGLLHALDLFGTGVFAFSGALTAGKKGMDLWGMITIATITSVGGGTVRDLLLHSGTVFWMRQPIYLYICIVVTLATYALWPTLEQRLGRESSSARAICIADALGLGAFAVLGTQTAADHVLATTSSSTTSTTTKLDPILWVVSGVMSATFGGVIRDVLCLQQPRTMYPHRTMYAAPPLLGSLLYTILLSTLASSTTRFQNIMLSKDQAALVAFIVTFAARILSFDNPRRLPHWKTDTEEQSTRAKSSFTKASV